MSVRARELEERDTIVSVGLVSAALSFLLVAALALLANRLSYASKLWLGRDMSSYGAFNGSLDEVAIFPRKLTSAEVHQLHELAPVHPPLHPPPDAAPKRSTGVVD